MASNGYSSLTPGPEAGWLGYYSLNKQGKLAGVSLEALIAQNSEAGLVWTDPEADTYICGHRGHFQTSCGLTFSATPSHSNWDVSRNNGPSGGVTSRCTRRTTKRRV